jgi:F-type H+-transporting ATPase subunit delta
MSSDTDQTIFDIESQHVANVYAKALVGAGEKSGATEQCLEELDAVVDEVLSKFPAFEETLVSRLVSDDDKVKILDRVFAGKTSTLMLDFLKVVAGHGRLDCLRAIRRAAHLQVDELRGRREVEVRYATAVDQSVTDEIATKIREQLGIDPKIKVATDPALLGGVVITIGDTVCDGSLATRLQSMRSSIVKETVHRIQTGRERFENGS